MYSRDVGGCLVDQMYRSLLMVSVLSSARLVSSAWWWEVVAKENSWLLYTNYHCLTALQWMQTETTSRCINRSNRSTSKVNIHSSHNVILLSLIPDKVKAEEFEVLQVSMKRMVETQKDHYLGTEHFFQLFYCSILPPRHLLDLGTDLDQYTD